MISALRFSALLRTSSSEVIFSASSWALRMIRSLSLRASSSIAWRSFTIQRACLSSSGIVWRIWSMMSKAASRSIMAVLPKPGKLLASSTSSSNLSISTSTSILQTYPSLTIPIQYLYITVRARIYLAHGLQYAFRHQPAHVAAKRRYLPHGARGEEAVLRGGHYEERLELREHRPVELRLLELRLEIRDSPQALDYGPRPLFASEVHEQTVHQLHRDVLDVRGDLLYKPGPLECGEHRLLAQVSADRYDYVVEDLRGPPDDVEVPRSNGVEAPGTDRHDHCSLRALKYRHVRAAVAARRPLLDYRTLRQSLAALDHDPTAGREEGFKPGQHASNLRRRDSIWRISEYQIELSLVCKHPIQDPPDVTGDHLGPVLDPGPPQVLPDGRQRPPVLLHEHGSFGAPAQRLYAQSAGPGVQVEHVAAEELTQRVENALPHAVRGRAY